MMNVACTQFSDSGMVILWNDDMKNSAGFSWSYQNANINGTDRQIQLQTLAAGEWSTPRRCVMDDFGTLVYAH